MGNYGTLEVPLGEIQRLRRGDVDLPMYGGPQTLANAHFDVRAHGKVVCTKGDSYIMYARFGKDGLESLETINAYGNSSKSESPHYTDQMELYVNRKVKRVELDQARIREQAASVYHPK